MRARVLLVTSEAVPLIKTGGLGDVITVLASSLRDQGIDATILMPGYPQALDNAGVLREVGTLDDLPGGPGRLLHGYMPDSGVAVVLLDTERFQARTANPYVDQDGAEYGDNAICFAALAHAAVRICAGRSSLPVPHVVHANDWHAGLIPALLRLEGVDGVGSVLTIHNLAFQGNYPMERAASLGIPETMLTADAMEFWGQISYLKAGIRFADRITTVSKSYSQEILTPRFGHGMDGVLNARKEALIAIPNGVDVDLWNPSNDALIARNFSLNDMRGKSACKRDLQNLFGLPQEPFAPVLALGSRITHQKMADVALQALPEILNRHPRLQIVVLGCGDHGYEQGFMQLAKDHPDRIGVHIGYDERHAHALHAGADMLLHGTRFEPFGLTPIYAMRYGTIPIASRVGGLIDTVVDAGAEGPARGGAQGILFDGERGVDMVAAVDRAFELFSHASEWQAMQRNAMSADFAWAGPTKEYISLYEQIAPAAARALFANPQPEVIEMQPEPMRA
ncbi:MAG: glgA [Noviherbaspirillum sp.]|nr:glgA [Noviherbaspirillum sp.]